jgi:hypothetical protein
MDTLGFDNASPAANTTFLPGFGIFKAIFLRKQPGNFQFAAPKPIQLLRRYRLTPYPTLCTSLETY